MVEMTETAEILKKPTSPSWSFFDEVGRGTSTFRRFEHCLGGCRIYSWFPGRGVPCFVCYFIIITDGFSGYKNPAWKIIISRWKSGERKYIFAQIMRRRKPKLRHRSGAHRRCRRKWLPAPKKYCVIWRKGNLTNGMPRIVRGTREGKKQPALSSSHEKRKARLPGKIKDQEIITELKNVIYKSMSRLERSQLSGIWKNKIPEDEWKS